MNKKYNAPTPKAKKGFKSILFWGLIIAITVFFIVFDKKMRVFVLNKARSMFKKSNE